MNLGPTTRVRNNWLVLRLPFRWFTGRPLDGYRRTDSTFLHRATRNLQPGRPSRWSMLAGWHRATVRALVALWTVAVGTYALTSWVPAATAAGVITADAIVWAVWRGHLGVSRWRHYRQWVRPLHETLGPILGHPVQGTAGYLHIPHDFDQESSTGVRVDVPAHLVAEPATQHQVVTVVAARLGLRSPDVSWRLQGSDPHVVVKAAPQPPRRVGLDAIRAAVDAASDSAPVLGIGPRGKTIDVDLDAESPHVLVSAGSGGGKSVLVRVIAAQILNRGGRVVILDVKRISHRWAVGLPGVEYHRDVADIHRALIELRDEGTARYSVIEGHDGDEGTADVGERVALVAEEMNATIVRLQRHWEDIRDRDDPKRSPAVDALGELLFMGRACRIHVIAVAQMASARSLGGPEARENFATRILARYTVNAWRMLVPEVWPMPRASKHAGRVQVVKAGQAESTQVAFLTPEDARQLALAGRPYVARSVLAPRPGLHLVETPPAEEAPPALIGLREATTQVLEIVQQEISLESLRAARKRDDEFPKPKGLRGKESLYEAQELAFWARNRQRAAETESSAG